jgi:hypothetical protein
MPLQMNNTPLSRPPSSLRLRTNGEFRTWLCWSVRYQDHWRTWHWGFRRAMCSPRNTSSNQIDIFLFLDDVGHCYIDSLGSDLCHVPASQQRCRGKGTTTSSRRKSQVISTISCMVWLDMLHYSRYCQIYSAG